MLTDTAIYSESGDTLQYRLEESEETRELPGERDNARNNIRCMQTRKTTHGLDGQHQYVDRTIRGRQSQSEYDTIRYSIFTCAQKLTRWPV